MGRYRMGYLDDAGETASHYFHAASDAEAISIANALAGESEASWVSFDKQEAVDASGEANWSIAPVANSSVREKATIRYTVPAGGVLAVNLCAPKDSLVSMHSRLGSTDPLAAETGLQTEEGNASGVFRDVKWNYKGRKG